MQREKKRFFLFNKYYNKYNKFKNEVKDRIVNKKNNFFDNMIFLSKFQNFPRNSNGTRIRNRCYLTGRPRGVFRRFGLSRCVLRDLCFKGFIPGIFKSSW